MNEAFFNIDYPLHFSNKIKNFNQQERNISYIELPLEQINISENIKEYSSNLKTELKKFYKENINQYMSKEKRNIEYSIIDKTIFSSNFFPTDLEINEYYNINKDLFFKMKKEILFSLTLKQSKKLIISRCKFKT